MLEEMDLNKDLKRCELSFTQSNTAIFGVLQFALQVQHFAQLTRFQFPAQNLT